MPGQINVSSPGLLSLMQLKTGGQQPTSLGDTVVPVLDIEGFYLRGQFQILSTTAVWPAAPVNGQIAFPAFNVPPGSWRYVSVFSVYMAMNAGTDLASWVLDVQMPVAGAAIAPHIYSEPTTAGLLGATANAAKLNRSMQDFWVPPGGTFNVQSLLNDNIAVPSTLYAAIQFADFPI